MVMIDFDVTVDCRNFNPICSMGGESDLTINQQMYPQDTNKARLDF